MDLFVKCYSSQYNDISYRIGKDTDIVKRVFIHYGGSKPLTATNRVLASKYECGYKVLFPDISNDDDLCKRLLEALLS